MEKKFVSAVIYLHNDEKRIESFLKLIIVALKENFEQYEVVLVDDACEDDTISFVRNLTSQVCREGTLSILHMGFYQGIEPSMNAGRDVAIGDFVYEFDDVGLDFDENLLMEVYMKMTEGYDIVSASPQGLLKVTSRIFYSLFNHTNRGNVQIGPERFRLISRRAINRIKSSGKYIPYRKAVYANSGLKMAAISYVSTSSIAKGRSSFRERGGLAFDSFIYFTNILERISLILSGAFLATSLGVFLYSIIDHFSERGVVEGWASTMVVMSVGFFGVFSLLTIVLKYLSVMLNLVFKQQKYLVSDIEKVK